MDLAEVVHSDPTLRIAQHRNLVLIAWSDAPTVEQLRACERAARAAGRRNAGGIALLDLILGGTPRFSDGVREETTRLNRDPSLFPLGVANVVLVPGLTGVAVRAFLNTVALVGRPVVPTKAFAALREAAEWLSPMLSNGVRRFSPDEIVAIARPFERKPKAEGVSAP